MGYNHLTDYFVAMENNVMRELPNAYSMHASYWEKEGCYTIIDVWHILLFLKKKHYMNRKKTGWIYSKTVNI